MNWNYALTAIGPVWVTQLLNMPLASVVNIYTIAFMLEADILSFEHTL